MAPFVFAIRESNPQPELKTFTEVAKEDYHNIQTHTVELQVLEDAQARQQLLADEMARSRHSPDITASADCDLAAFMTPPAEGPAHQGPPSFSRVASATTTTAGTSSLPFPHHATSSVFLSPSSEAENSGYW